MSTGTRGKAIATFDLGTVRRFSDLAVQGLSAAREEIDALNVYPVPDGDTGTNMYLTVQAAQDALRQHLAECEGTGVEPDLREALGVYAKAALLGARGNSGVILSQLIGALLRRMGQGGPEDRSAVLMAEGFALATQAAYAAVGTPVEGTMLSVAKAASLAAATRAEDPEAHLGDVLRAAAQEAREALARTPDQMQLLRDAGVVDAGGRGLCVILDAAESAVTGQRAVGAPVPMGGARVIPRPLPTGDLTEGGPAYEVMYLLDAEDEAISGLRARLAELGDSLVVVGGEGLWNVHVHTDDVGAAVEAGIDAGRPRRIRVTHFAEQVTRARDRRAERQGRAVVAVVAGEGLATIFREAGAHVLVGSPGRRPSTGEILDAVVATGAAEVVVLPNDPDSVGVAQAAASAAEESEGVRVVVVPTRAQVQGIAAMAVHEPGRSFDSDVVQMTSAARGARHGAVTVAVKQAITTAGPCEAGDVLGVLQGDFAVVGQDLYEVGTAILERLLGGGGELVTLVAGADAGDLAQRCQDWVESHHAGVDVLVYEGGQERYPLLLAVE